MAAKILKHLLIFILAVVLTTALTWPFATKLGSYYTDSGDYSSAGANYWWSFDSIKSGRIFNRQDFFNGYHLYPLPYSFVYTDHLTVLALIFGFIYTATNNFIFSVNFFAFLSFVLTFISAFYVLNYFIKNYYASIIGAAVFTFNPMIFAQFPFHAYLLNRYFLPPIFLFAYKFFQNPNRKDAFFLGLFFTLNALSIIYYQIYTIFLLLILGLLFLSINLYRKHYLYIFNLCKNSLILLIFLPVLLYFNLPYLQFSQLEGANRTIGQNVYYSAKISDWFSPPLTSFIYKDLSFLIDEKRQILQKQDRLYYEEHTLFLNFVPVFLSIVALLAFLKSKQKKYFYYFLVLLLITSIMTLGPFFLGWNNDTGDTPLPFYYFYQYLPFGKGVRVPTRFQLIFYLPFAFFVSFGALQLFKKSGKYFLITFLLIFSLILIENINLYNFDDKSYILPKVDKLSQNGQLLFLQEKNVLHLPIIFPDIVITESVYDTWRVKTGEKIVNGNNAYYPPDFANFLLSLKKEVGVNQLKQLAALDVNYITIHKDLMATGQYEKEFKKNEDLYKLGAVFEQDETQIIDISKYNLNINKCDFKKDFDMDIKQAVVTGTDIVTRVLVLKNKSDCYLPSIYNDRYKSMDFYPNFIKQTISFRLPILIDPYQEVILSELNKELKIQ